MNTRANKFVRDVLSTSINHFARAKNANQEEDRFSTLSKFFILCIIFE